LLCWVSNNLGLRQMKSLHCAAFSAGRSGRLAWGSGPRGEPPNYTGLDVVIVRDGKIAALYVFLDPVQS
jgi:hypothetical protein